MTKEELIKAIIATKGGEEGHIMADALLLQYINDEEISEAFNGLPNMWYA